MLTYGIILMGAAMLTHGWWQLGVTEGRSTGWLNAAIGVALAAAVLAPSAIFGSASAQIGTLLVLWAVYAWTVAGAGALEQGQRTLGFYSAFATVAFLFYLLWFLGQGTVAGILVSAVLAISFFLLFLNQAPPLRGLTRLVAYLFTIAGGIVALIGLADLVGLLG